MDLRLKVFVTKVTSTKFENLFKSVGQGFFNGENEAALLSCGNLHVATAHLKVQLKFDESLDPRLEFWKDMLPQIYMYVYFLSSQYLN